MMVQVFPLQVNAGKMVREPMLLPCVLDVAEDYLAWLASKEPAWHSPASMDTLIVSVVPSYSSTVIVYVPP